jgi:autotransporter-associated beta strand protein
MIGRFFVKGSCPAFRSAAALASFVAVVLATTLPARGQDNWSLSPSQSGGWSAAGNWSNGVPSSSVNAFVANGGTAVIASCNAACNALILGEFTGGGTVEMTSGTLTIFLSGAAGITLGEDAGSSGTYNLSGSGQIQSANEIVGCSGSGTFTQSGGTNSCGGINCDFYLGYGTGSVGVYNLSGSGSLFVPDENVGDVGTGTFTQTGGTNSISYLLDMGYNAGSVASFSLSGGLLKVHLGENIGGYGTTTFFQSGGTNQLIQSGLSLGVAAGGQATYNLSGSGLLSAPGESVAYGAFNQSGGTNTVSGQFQVGQGGTYNLAGGLLNAVGISSSGVFNFSGGTLHAGSGLSTGAPITLGTGSGATFDTRGNTVTFSGILSGPGGLTLNDSLGTGTLVLAASDTYSGGTTVVAGTLKLGDGVANNGYVQGDILNNSAVTFANPATQTYSGVISGSGALAKAAGGSLLLTGNNTYTGPTTINQGTLLVDGSLISPVTVNSGGMLGGSGSLSSVTVASGGSLSPGAAPGAMNVSGSLTLQSGAKMDYALDTPTDSDEVYMPSGPLVLSGQQFADLNFTPLGGFGQGTYMLIDALSISGSLGTSTSGTIDGLPASIAIQGDDVVLNVVPEPGTLTLLGVGAVGMLGWVWRRKRAAARNSFNVNLPP